MPKADPFEEKDDDEKKPKPSEDEEEGKEVSTEPDENDDEPQGETGESAESRAEKKRNRFREAKEEAKQQKERADNLERQASEERSARIAAQTAAQMYAVQQQQSQQQQQQDPWAEYERHVKEKFQFILGETTRLRTENRLDEESTKRLQTEWIENQQRQQELTTRKLMWQEGQRQQQLQPQYEQQQRLAAVEARLQAEYPEVMNHAQAKAHAIGGWQMAMAANKPNTWDTARDVMAATMRAFRLGRPPPIDDTTKRRYSGIGGGSNGAGPGRATFKMTKAHEKMAEGRYPGIPPEQAHKKWAQTVGKKMLEEDS